MSIFDFENVFLRQMCKIQSRAIFLELFYKYTFYQILDKSDQGV